MGTSVRRVRRLRTSPQSLVVAGSLARRPYDLRTWFPGPSRGSLLEPVWRFNLPLRARRNVRAGALPPQRACPRSCDPVPESYPRTCGRCGRSVDTLDREVEDGSSDRPPGCGSGPMGPAARRVQPPLVERPVPPDQAGQGPPQRRLARPPAPRGCHGHPDRNAAARGRARSHRAADGGGHRADRHRPVHAGCGADRRSGLRRHRRRGSRQGHHPLDADGRRPPAAPPLAWPARWRPGGPDDPRRPLAGRLCHRRRGHLCRRRRRVHLREHGQPARLPRRRDEMDPPRHGRRRRPR